MLKNKVQDFGQDHKNHVYIVLRDDLILELHKFDGDRAGAAHRRTPFRQRGVQSIQPDSSLNSYCQVHAEKTQTITKTQRFSLKGHFWLDFCLFLFFIEPLLFFSTHTPYLSHRSADAGEVFTQGMGEELGRGGAGAHHAPPQRRGGGGSAMGRGGHLYEYYQVGLLDSHFTISRTNKVNKTRIVEEQT